MTLETIHNAKAVRNLSDRNSKKWDRGSRWVEAHGEENTIRDNNGNKLADADGEIHVDVSEHLDDLNYAQVDTRGNPQKAQWIPREGDTTLKISNLSNNFQKGDTITGGTSGATAVVESVAAEGSGYLQVGAITGTFVEGETITGAPSGATAVLVAEDAIVEIPQQRVLVMAVRDIATGALVAGSTNVFYTLLAKGIGV